MECQLASLLLCRSSQMLLLFGLILAYHRVEGGHWDSRSALEQFRQYQVFEPQVYSEGRRVNSTDLPGGHLPQLIVIVSAFGKQLQLDLSINKNLFSSSYVERYFSSKGEELDHDPRDKEVDHCYYHGHVHNELGSVVALSTCSGIRGYVADSEETYHIEPLDGTISGQHHIYRDSDQVKNYFKCGVGVHEDVFHNSQGKYHRRWKRTVHWPYDKTEETKIVELYVANDIEQYAKYDASRKKVIERTKQVVNVVSSLYRPLNIYVALVGVEVWTDDNQIEIVENAEQTMNNFLEYRRTYISPKYRNDNAQLLTGQRFGDGVVGKAPINTICSYQYSGGVNMDHSTLVGPVATTVAHEMGHNFGLTHDLDKCTCPDEKCIMAASSGGTNPVRWSSCSLDQFGDSFHQGMDYCLHNLPDKLFDKPVCGNGFQEDGEECDCGLPQDCDVKCCNASTCTLTVNSTCATGACCDLETCQLKPAATVCRTTSNECDLPEHCNGVSQFCPYDVFVQDGRECEDNKSYCYHGKCSTQDKQCKKLWGTTGKVSHRSCFEYFNVKGQLHGHCGFHWVDKSFDACAEKDVMCGMLHCEHRNEKLAFWKEALAYTMPNSYVTVGGVKHGCKGAILDVGLNKPDPGMVPDGSRCGYRKICLNQKCESVDKLDVKQCSDCHGHGVCNSIGQCHCDLGYGPPLCNKAGNGGSDHSGPLGILGTDTGLVVGMCLLFLLILPLLAITSFMAYRKRDKLKKLWHPQTSDKYRDSSPHESGDTTAHPRNDIVKTQRPKPTATTNMPRSVRPPPQNLQRQPSFRPEDISSPRLQSSTNVAIIAGPIKPQANGIKPGVLRTAPQPGINLDVLDIQTRLQANGAKPVPRRPAPVKPSASFSCTPTPRELLRNTPLSSSTQIKPRPPRPPPPSMGSVTEVIEKSDPTDSDNRQPHRPRYQNVKEVEFEDIPLSSPASPPPSYDDCLYANETQDISSSSKAGPSIADRINRFETASSKTNSSSSEPTKDKRKLSTRAVKPSLPPKPVGGATRQNSSKKLDKSSSVNC